MISFRVAPPDCFSRSTTLAVLLPWRAPAGFWRALAPFLAGVALLADFALVRGTRGTRAPVPAFLGASSFSAAAVAWFACWRSVIDLVISHCPLAVITAVTTSIALVGHTSKFCRSLRKAKGSR